MIGDMGESILQRLKGIEVHPLAFESLGVRSMSTFIRTPDVSLLIDPGVALGPRKPISPHPREYFARNECRARILDAASKSDVLFISHYHHDHYTPNYVEMMWLGSTPEIAESIYRGKIILAKDIRNLINFSQRRRGWIFKKGVEKNAKSFMTADDKIVEYGNTKLKFSVPVYHGEQDSGLGWVLMLSITSNDEKVVYAPDVQGPMSTDTVEAILREKPDLLIIGGPPLYLQGFKVSEHLITLGLENIARLAARIPTTVVDHHLLRSSDWKSHLEKAFTSAERSGNRLVTAAEFAGAENTLLESIRQKLYDEDPPSKEFSRWVRLPREERRRTAPPL
jgi:predicted metallo-beta-lactamase superfamily hydrolase